MEAYHNEVRGWLSRNDKCFLIRIPTVLLKLHILSLHGIKKRMRMLSLKQQDKISFKSQGQINNLSFFNEVHKLKRIKKRWCFFVLNCPQREGGDRSFCDDFSLC